MSADAARSWIADETRSQAHEGDRIVLHLPPALCPDPHAYTDNEWAERRHPHNRHGVAIVDAYSGGKSRPLYLDHDLADIGPWGVYPNVYQASKCQHLALVALAAVVVSRATGSTRSEATAWLLCDVPIPAREIRAYPYLGFPSGLWLWVPEPLLTIKELGQRYARVRHSVLPSAAKMQRAKHPEARTGFLIEYVSRVRPHAGKHADNATWQQVLEEWNGAHPEWAYADSDSIERAYKAALKRRARLGLLPGEGGDA